MTDELNILYVEDDAQSRMLMEILFTLRMNLSHFTIFEDSRDLLARLAALTPKPTLILLDIHVRPYDGFEMLAMLRQLDWAQTLPIIALTASVMNEEVEQLRSAGFNGCVAKPIDIQTMPDILMRIAAGEEIWRIVN